jgi:hypothetical protein
VKKLYSAVLGIEQGATVLFSDFQDEGEMWTGKGPRQKSMPVSYSEAFREEPTVSVSLDLFDFSNTTNLRYEITAENITRGGFDIVFKTWGDTKIARARANWTALGPIDGEGDWDV